MMMTKMKERKVIVVEMMMMINVMMKTMEMMQE